MSSDLVKRLRAAGLSYGMGKLPLEAADAIEALEGERDKLKWSMEKYEDRAEAAEARAERLRVALVQFNNHFGPLADNAMLHPEARKCFHLARKALEDDKPASHAAAGGEG